MCVFMCVYIFSLNRKTFKIQLFYLLPNLKICIQIVSLSSVCANLLVRSCLELWMNKYLSKYKFNNINTLLIIMINEANSVLINYARGIMNIDDSLFKDME